MSYLGNQETFLSLNVHGNIQVPNGKKNQFWIYNLALMQDPLILTVKSKDSIILIVYIHRFSKSTFGKFS